MATVPFATDNSTVPVVDADARTFWYAGNFVQVPVDSADTDGRFAVVETVARPGSEPPLHVHHREDETFIVIEGEVQVTCGGKDYRLGAGDVKFAPRGIPHTFRILTPEARMVNVITPGGFENFFRTLGWPAGVGAMPPAGSRRRSIAWPRWRASSASNWRNHAASFAPNGPLRQLPNRRE